MSIIKCYKCNGIGLVETQLILCKNCDGKKCYLCRGTGYLQYAWSECDRCIGVGSDGKETEMFDRVQILKKKLKSEKK